jgi:hypothetical protein
MAAKEVQKQMEEKKQAYLESNAQKIKEGQKSLKEVIQTAQQNASTSRQLSHRSNLSNSSQNQPPQFQSSTGMLDQKKKQVFQSQERLLASEVKQTLSVKQKGGDLTSELSYGSQFAHFEP